MTVRARQYGFRYDDGVIFFYGANLRTVALSNFLILLKSNIRLSKGGNMIEIVGQILGVIAFFIAFASYQMKSRNKLLVLQIMLTLVMSAHYFCIAAYPAMAMNLFGVVRNIVYYRNDIFRWKYIPVIFTIMMFLIGIFTSSGAWSVLVIAGLTINTYCLSFKNPQHFRISLLITCSLVLLYDIIVFSLGGIMLESISIISALIGIFRNRQISK